MRSGDSPNERSPLLDSSPGTAHSSHRHHEEEEVSTAQSSGMQGDAGQVTARGQVVMNTVRLERQVRNNLYFRYEYYEFFVYSQCLPAWLLLIFRLAMGCICTGVFLYLSIMSPFVNFVPSNSTSGDDDGNGTTEHTPTFKRHFYLCYLTIWSYLVITVYFITTLINTVAMCTCTNRSGESRDFSLAAGGFKSTDNLLDTRGEIPSPAAGGAVAGQFGLRLQWLLCGVAANAALLVTVAYFGVLYPMIKRVSPGPISSLDLLVHGFNSVFMLVEVACSGVPVRLVHALYTALYGLTYALFSLLYWIPDHSNVIYPVLLDWNNAGLTVAMMGLILLVGLPVIQLIWWLVYLTRCYLAAAVLSRSSAWGPGLRV